jgi:hypothetical protein
VTVCGEQLEIEVTPATKFCDTDDYCYSARSKNRGQVLIINNVRFDTERHQTRRGAEVDEGNLKELFVKIGLSVDMYRNLTRDVNLKLGVLLPRIDCRACRRSRR